MLHCQNCGIQLTLGTTQCPNCGTFVSPPAPPSGNQGSYNPPSWRGQAPPGGGGGYNPPSWRGQAPPGEYSPSLRRGQPPSGEYSPSLWAGRTQADGGAAPGSPGTFQEVSPSLSSNAYEPSWTAQPQQPSSYANASMPFSQQASPVPLPPPPTQSGVSKRMFITLVTLAVLVILSGIILISYTTVVRPAQLSTNATATVQALSTTSAGSTATVQVQATGAAHVHTQATAQAKATATAIQSVYANATSSSPAFGSSLAFQGDGNWDVYNAVGGGGCVFTDEALHSTIMKKSYYVPCFAKATNFNNFVLETEVTIVKGDEGGLIFRANDKASKFYYFGIGRNGFYCFNVSKDEKNSIPLIYDTSSAIKTKAGEMNLLTVIARDKEIYLFINKQFVAGTTDASYSSGEIGVLAGNNGNETDVAFSNLRVWSL